MKRDRALELVVPQNFIQATRDSGYKSLGSAIAELIDNSFEANAQHVIVSFAKDHTNEVSVTIADDGCGMDATTLQHSLRFGWSSRFNQRCSHGRYGMGLPNASLSHARRVEVWSSTGSKRAHSSCLDIDEILNRAPRIQPASSITPECFKSRCPFKRGTVVTWHRCDRLAHRKLGPLARKLRNELGLLFRYKLWEGKAISVDGEQVKPIDPLFMRSGENLRGGVAFGPQLTFEIEITTDGIRKKSQVDVNFSELPVRTWHQFSNEEKNERGIAKNAGVSIVRAGREIDHGWFFMGQKRKENYDDWWRCEVRFQPDLDELFGVTHTKQEVHPTECLTRILTPDIERIARELNGRARQAFLDSKKDYPGRESERVAQKHDHRLEPPTMTPAIQPLTIARLDGKLRGRIGGLEYRLRFEKLDTTCLYEPFLSGGRVTVLVNESHPLVHSLFYATSIHPTTIKKTKRDLELLIFAAARSELALTRHHQARTWITKFRQTWSDNLAAFLA